MYHKSIIVSLTLMTLNIGSSPANAQDNRDKYRLDTTKFIYSQVEPDSRIRSEDENPDEFHAYNDALMQANQFPTNELLAHARRDVTFRDLLAQHRRDYQFQLIRFEGRLKRLKKIEATKPLKAAGIDNLYEAWVFPLRGTEPLCVVLTEPPEGLEPASLYQPAKLVSVAGYYFKALRYDAEERVEDNPEKHVVRRAPLLLGHSLAVQPEPKRADSSVDLGVVLAIIAGVLAVVLGYVWWVAQSDRGIRREVQARLDPNPFDGSQS